jgi:hypothetical protein
MTHSKLRVEVRALTFWSRCEERASERYIGNRKHPGWRREYGPEDPDAPITFNEFRTLAWMAANEMAQQLGWIKSHDELHEAVKLAASGM